MPDKNLISKKNFKKRKKFYRNLNIVISIAIIILLIVVIIRFNVSDLLFDQENTSNEPPLPFRDPPAFPANPIINSHDHINSLKVLEDWLESQHQCNVTTTIMVGSPRITFYGTSKEPFDGYLENNKLLIKMAHETNGEIIAFPTLNPNDDDNLERLKTYLKQGARGLNLWTGHHGTISGPWGETNLFEWLGPMNRTDMYPIYEYCQENRIPIIWSNNLGIQEVRDNLWSILEKFPDMIIKIPHMGVCFRDYNLPYIESFLDNYTGLYTCFSWGHPDYVMEKFENVSGVRNEAIKGFFEKYQDRIMFGTDVVPTPCERKSLEWLYRHTQAYKDIMEEDYYHIEIQNFKKMGEDYIVDYRGLNLSKTILDKVYFNNSIKFLNGKKWNESLNESGMVRKGRTHQMCQMNQLYAIIDINDIKNNQKWVISNKRLFKILQLWY